MKIFFKIFGVILGVLYPVFIFLSLVVFKLPTRIISLCIIIFGFTLFLSVTGKRDKEKKFDMKPFANSALLLTAGVICFFTNQELFLKLYSVAISVMFFVMFGSTLFNEPNMIFRFATLQDKSIVGSFYEKDVKKYCKTVTIIWCCFFIINGTISTLTALSSSIFHISKDTANTVWSIYNGGISYVLMGLLFAIEFIIRIQYNKKLINYIPITSTQLNSRKKKEILCWNKCDKKNSKKYWNDFISETSILTNFFETSTDEKYILSFQDNWYFLITLFSLLQAKKIPVISTENDSENNIPKITDDDLSNCVCVKNILKTESTNANIKKIDSNCEINFLINGCMQTKKLQDLEDDIYKEIVEHDKNLVKNNNMELNLNKNSYDYTKQILLHLSIFTKFYR